MDPQINYNHDTMCLFLYLLEDKVAATTVMSKRRSIMSHGLAYIVDYIGVQFMSKEDFRDFLNLTELNQEDIERLRSMDVNRELENYYVWRNNQKVRKEKKRRRIRGEE